MKLLSEHLKESTEGFTQPVWKKTWDHILLERKLLERENRKESWNGEEGKVKWTDDWRWWSIRRCGWIDRAGRGARDRTGSVAVAAAAAPIRVGLPSHHQMGMARRRGHAATTAARWSWQVARLARFKRKEGRRAREQRPSSSIRGASLLAVSQVALREYDDMRKHRKGAERRLLPLEKTTTRLLLFLLLHLLRFLFRLLLYETKRIFEMRVFV